MVNLMVMMVKIAMRVVLLMDLHVDAQENQDVGTAAVIRAMLAHVQSPDSQESSLFRIPVKGYKLKLP